MPFLKKIYSRIHRFFARPGEKGEYSSGVWQDAVRKQAIKFLEGSGGRILEVGCGEGLFLTQLIKAAPEGELYGVDNDSGRAELARIRLENISPGTSGRVIFINTARLPFPDSYFDAVVCINVTLALPSMDAVKAVFAEMVRVTKKSGTIIFEYRNRDNPLLVAKYRLAPYYDETVKNYPFTMLKPEWVNKLINDSGLRLKRIAYLPRFFGRSKWLNKIAPIVIIEAEKQ